MGPDQFDSIVTAAYDAAAGRIRWADAVHRLAEAIDAWSVDLVGFDRPSLAVSFDHPGGPAPAQFRLDYLRGWNARYPAIDRVKALSEGAWFHDHEHLPATVFARDPFYRDFLATYGGKWVSVTKLHRTPERTVMLTVVRALDRPPLSTEEVAWLDRVRGHLVRALELGRHLRQAEPLPLPGSELLEHFSRPMVLVDEDGRVLHANAAARAFLGAGDPALERNGRIALRQPEDDRRLKQAIKRGPALVGAVSDARRIVNARRAADGSVVAVLVLAVGGDQSVHAFGESASAVLTFVDPHAARPLDPVLVAQAFDLTPAESRVAIQLAQGHTIEQIARNNGVSMATVRTQLKSLFAKTRTNRQADLVRLVNSLPEIDAAGHRAGVPRRRS